MLSASSTRRMRHGRVGHAVGVPVSIGALRAALLLVGTLLTAGYSVAVLGILFDTEHGWDLVVPLVAHAVVTTTVAVACLQLCGRVCDRAAERGSDHREDGTAQATTPSVRSHAAG